MKASFSSPLPMRGEGQGEGNLDPEKPSSQPSPYPERRESISSILLLATAILLVFPIPSALTLTLWAVSLAFFLLTLARPDVLVLLPYLITIILALTIPLSFLQPLPILIRGAAAIGVWSGVLVALRLITQRIRQRTQQEP